MDEEWVAYDGGVVRDWHRSARRIRVAPHVTVIPQEAFEDCEELRVVDLGNVAAISDNAFCGCHSLEHVVWAAASAVEIGNSAFAFCQSLNEIDLSHVTKIGDSAFLICSALRRVRILSSAVDKVEGSAFSSCTNLMEVELGGGITRIGKSAFQNCRSLVRVTIPPSVTDIEAFAFQECRGLVEVEICEGLQHVGARAFQNTSLLSIIIPSTTLKVGDRAFAGCNQLRHAELQEGLQTIGSWAFFDCHSLERITIPSSVTDINSDAFRGCCSLAEVTLQSTLVGPRAFGGCKNLAEVTLCEGVHCIEGGAFMDCPALEHINIPPVTFVIDVEGSSCQLLKATPMPKPLGKTLVVSKWMQYRSPGQLAQAEAKVNTILDRNVLTEGAKIQCIREWFAYYNLIDATTMLELAIWRSKMHENERGTEARQAIRKNCGSDMNVIIPGVLSFLEGVL